MYTTNGNEVLLALKARHRNHSIECLFASDWPCLYRSFHITIQYNIIQYNTVSLLQFICCRGMARIEIFKPFHTTQVWQESNETDFLFTKVFIFSNINLIPFKIVPLGSYTPMETLFPLLVAVLEVFYRYGLQHVRYTLLDIFL